MKYPRLTPNEYELMDHVWRKGSASVGEVHARIGEENSSTVSRTTVQVQMQRLHKKGWLRRLDRAGRVIYEATCSREEADWQLASDLTDRIFDGSLANLVSCFVSSRRIDPSELERLRRIIDEEDEK